MRQVKEWKGRTDDAMPPPMVRLRIFENAGGICHLCETKIHAVQKWHASHLKSIWDGGENREKNIAPAHEKCHQRHTAQERSEQCAAKQKKAKHLGIRKPSSFQSRGFEKAPPQNRATAPIDKWRGF